MAEPIGPRLSRARSSSSHARSLFRKHVLAFSGENARDFPWRAATDPYLVLVGEILLQRTRGEQVEPVYRQFVRRWPTITALARARERTIAAVIAPLGLPKRASTFRELARALVAAGDVPLNPSELLLLPGVGPYAAHAVPVFAAGRDLPLVDWVIARVLRRYFGLAEGRRPNQDRVLWRLAEDLSDPGNARSLWLGTLDLAAAVCRPRPVCNTCPLRSGCDFASSRASREVQHPH